MLCLPSMYKYKGKSGREGRCRLWPFIFTAVFFWSLIFSPASANLLVPNGSTLNVNDNTLRVEGDITLEGTIQTTTGTVGVSRDWNNTSGTGTYLPGNGTLELYGAAGTQNINAGGTAAGKLFYHLIHNGAGSVEIGASDLNVDGNFSNTSGTFNAGDNSIVLAGNWGGAPAIGAATFNPGTQTVMLDGCNQNLYGYTDGFWNLTKESPGCTISFDHLNTSEQIVRGQLTLKGAAGNLMSIRSTQAGDQGFLTLAPNGTQDLAYLDVRDSDAGGVINGSPSGLVGITLVARNSPDQSAVGFNNFNWLFGSVTITWQGDVNDNWNEPRNWDLGIVPVAGDTANIPDVTASAGQQPRFTSNVTVENIVLLDQASVNMDTGGYTFTATNLEIQDGAVFDIKNGNINVANLVNTGTVKLYGLTAPAQSIAIASHNPVSGTFEFTGNGAGASETFDLKDFGAIDYYNLVIAATGVNPDIWQTNANLLVKGDLTVSSGELNTLANNNSLEVGDDIAFVGDINVNGGVLTTGLTVTAHGNVNLNNGNYTAALSNFSIHENITITNGTFAAPDGAHTFTLSGDFTHNGGAFVHSSGSLNLTGDDQTIAGTAATTFYGLQKIAATQKDLIFGVDSSVTIAADGLITLLGSDNAVNYLYVKSAQGGTPAYLELLKNGTQNIRFVWAQDMNASGEGPGGSGAANILPFVARESRDILSGGVSTNVNWFFDSITLTWDGDISNDWDTRGNWDLGLLPTIIDSVIIPNKTNDPSLLLTTGVEIVDILIQDNAQLSLNGKDLDVAGILTSTGTVEAYGNETITIASNSIGSGAFKYVGTNTGATHTISIFNGDVGYYDLQIADANLTPDNFITAGVLPVNHNLQVSGGTFTPGGNITVVNDVNVSGGVLDVELRRLITTTTGTLTLSGGQLDASDGNIDINGNVNINGGALIAPSTGTFTIAASFSHSGGAFTHSSGTVVFDTTNPIEISGDTTFNNIEIIQPGKTVTIAANSTQTIVNDVQIRGESGNFITFNSNTPGTQWNIIATNTGQDVQFAAISDSDIGGDGNAGNDIQCFSCGNVSGNDDLDPSPHWVFNALSIAVPFEGRTTDRTPTVIGTSDPGDVVTIKALVGGILTEVASAVTDANGNFRVEVADLNPIDEGVNYLIPYLGALEGGRININVAAAPAAELQPSITSPAEGLRLNGANPTISGYGKPDTAFDILASDANGNLLLQSVGSGTVGADLGSGSGFYEITLTTPLPKGTVYLSVTVDGDASDIITYVMSDIYGVIFDSIENTPVQNVVLTLYRVSDGLPAVVGVDIDANDQNPFTTLVDGAYSFLTINGDYYVDIDGGSYNYPSSIPGFPPDRSIINGSKGENFTTGVNSGAIMHMDQPLDFNWATIRIEKTVNKSEVKIGEVVTYTVKIENTGRSLVENIFIEDKIPPGFKYLSGRVTLEGLSINEPVRARPLNFFVDDFMPHQVKYLKYQLVVGSGVSPGSYLNRAAARYEDGETVSNVSTAEVKVVLDPLFDLGTVIGKIFFDHNENGVQDPPQYIEGAKQTLLEEPVPSVKIVMEDGTEITADKDGQFHLQGILPGRHLFRLDERTLPEGSYLTTDKVVIVDITPGLLVKVNFGVNIDNDKMLSEDYQYFIKNVNVRQDQAMPEQRLHASAFPNEIAVYEDLFVEPVEFRIFMNYAPFIDSWKLQIIDTDTTREIHSFQGNALNIYDPIIWDGKDSKGVPVGIDRNYQFIVSVEGQKGKFDEIKPVDLVFKIIKDEEELDEYKEKQKKERAENYLAWVESEKAKNTLFVSTILVTGETVTIDPLNADLQSVKIMRDGRLIADLPTSMYHGLTAREILEGGTAGRSSVVQVVLPRGDYEIVVSEGKGPLTVTESKIEEGGGYGIESYGSLQKEVPISPARSYVKKVRIGEDYMFFVGLGDAKMGYTIKEGDIEPVAQDDKLRGGFWSEGKAAYYLKGKIKGKYLITSSYDTDRAKKEIFSKLDDDGYYPVYGDDAVIDKKATDTQGRLYLLVEWDKSSGIWGNYNVEFKDTEFAQYTRSLYGGKIDFESLSTTPYGESRSKAVVFHSRAKQKSAHNEFLATGGSLYYLKHKKIIEGSDVIKVEVRDQITGIIKRSVEMKEGADYEMDYNDGRIIFWRPIQMMLQQYSIIEDDILRGELIYVVADYAYDSTQDYDEANQGGRVRQAVGDHVIVGGTYIEESQDTGSYKLRGSDVTVHLGKTAKVVAEYAESESGASPSFVSTDGGVNFTDISTAAGASGMAIGLRGDAVLFNRLALTGSYKWVENDFSTTGTALQPGKELISMEAVYDLAEGTRLLARHDIQTLIDDGTLQTRVQLGALKTTTSSLQMIHELRKLTLTTEYRKQVVTEKINEYDTPTNREEDLVAVGAEYRVSDKLKLGAKHQMEVKGDEGGDQTTLSMEAKPTEKVTIGATKIIGESGLSSNVNVQVEVDKMVKLKGAYTVSTEQNKPGFVYGGDTEGSLGISKETDKAKVTSNLGAKDNTGDRSATASIGAAVKVHDALELESALGVTDIGKPTMRPTLGMGGKSALVIDENNKLETQLALNDFMGSPQRALTVSGITQADARTQTETKLSFVEDDAGGAVKSYTFGSRRKLTDELEMETSKTFGTNSTENNQQNAYKLIRVKDGKKLEGSLTRGQSEDAKKNVSRSNILGVSGDINDRWAMTASYERGNVQNYDGTRTERDVMALALAYAKRDAETGDEIKSSTKLETRYDKGENGGNDKRQFLFYNSTEGNVTSSLKVFSKIEFSNTKNLTTSEDEAEHFEMSIGSAYRPVMHDWLNLIARYTYQENQAPSGQVDGTTTDVEQTRAHIISAEGIIDLTNKWQLSQKYAYRIQDEKVTGFDFAKTHTWLMIHRLNYKIDADWVIGGEYRMLRQEEAQDVKQGMLLEIARNIGPNAQMGAGWNFTQFNDDLTALDYTAQGPFLRVTGKMYDRTPEEKERAKEKWIQQRVDEWAWQIISRELNREESPILSELNAFYFMAEKARYRGDMVQAQQIYREVVMAAQLMLDEARGYVREHIDKEERLRRMKMEADQYFKSGQYEKAKKILEKIVEEVEVSVLE